MHCISTHDLTRRSTRDYFKGGQNDVISTHDLTRRSTSLPLFFKAPHWYFNSRPHKEVDAWVSPPRKASFISTHDLTRRSTFCLFFSNTGELFQLTTSQGGRLQSVWLMDLVGNFNSRPHKEVDFIFRLYITFTVNFNSRPHKEVDNTAFYWHNAFIFYFNSRPHKEVDNHRYFLF